MLTKNLDSIKTLTLYTNRKGSRSVFEQLPTLPSSNPTTVNRYQVRLLGLMLDQGRAICTAVQILTLTNKKYNL